MTVKECYDAMGADYEDVFARLRKDERIQKFLLKVMNDKSYDLLCSSLERLKEQTEYGSDIEPMLDRVREDYERTISCIRELDGQ